MRIAIAFFFVLLCWPLFGQIKPDIFPEDIGSEALHTRCFCSPGVRNKSRTRGLDIAFNYLTSGKFKEQSSAFTGPLTSFEKFLNYKVSLKAPVVNKEGFKLVLGYKFFAEQYVFDSFGPDFKEVFEPLEETTLKNSALSLIIAKPINETKYLIFRLAYAANGNYNSFIAFKDDYSIYKFTGIYGVKPTEDLEWGIGVNISKSFRRFSALPFLIYNRNFNSKWGIESALPANAFMRYNLTDKNLFLMGAEYRSKSYRLDLIDDAFAQSAYAYNHSELLASVEMEHQFVSWLWASIKLGYQLNFSSNFEAKNESANSFDADPTNNAYLQFSLFLSPPK